jgi:release factor glutamine methyltransferase
LTIVERLRAAGCVFAEEEAELLLAEATDAADLEAKLARRVSGDPLEYVLGWAEFRGLRIAVEPSVFVPRTRSGLLVERAATGLAPGSTVVDLCCGSGAIGVALAAEVDDLELYATELDPAAVACARRNLTGPRQTVLAGDLFEPLPVRLRGRVDVIVANLPYVPTEQIALMPREAREHEARIALDGGPDGLDLHRRAAAAAPAWLVPGGRLLIETGRRQAPDTAEILAQNGFEPLIVTDDEIEGTAVIGTTASRGTHRIRPRTD